MSKDAPVVVFSESISFCHIVRPLIFSRLFKTLKRKVVVACADKFAGLFHQHGFETTNLTTTNPTEIYHRLAKRAWMYEVDDLLRYYREDQKIIDSMKPGLIVSDFRFTALQLAKKMGIPSIGITSASCHPNFPIGSSTPNAYLPPKFFPLKIFNPLSRTLLGDLVRKNIIRSISRTLRTASCRMKLPALDSFFHYAAQGDVCVLADHPMVMPIPRLRTQDIYSGALIWKREEPLSIDETALKQRKVVYISVGTQEALDTAFLSPLLNKLLQQNLNVVLSKGNRKFEIDVRHPNLFIQDFINESRLLQMVDLWIYSGSAMSTYHGLHYGVPMVAIPAQADQHFHAEAIRRLGCGTYIYPSRMEVDQLVEISLRILKEDGIKRNCIEISRELRGFNQTNEIMQRIERLLS